MTEADSKRLSGNVDFPDKRSGSTNSGEGRVQTDASLLFNDYGHIHMGISRQR